MSEELHRRLRDSAEDFRPDSDRMWERVAAGMSEPRPVKAAPVCSRFRVPHLAIATGAVVVLIAAIVFIGNGLAPLRPPVAGDPESSGPATGPPPTERVSERPASDDGLEGLDAVGSVYADGNDYWSQGQMVLTVDEPVTEMTVELRVSMRDDMWSTGSWNTAEHYFGKAEITEAGGYLIYRWVLVDDTRLPPGQYTLAGQYNHDEGARKSEGDYFVIEAVSESGSGTIVDGLDDPDAEALD
ncbi:hypothetical protein GCM10027447_16090 [Glycomyces halotolerans]